MANISIAGVRGTTDWGTDERPKDFREMILFRNPNGLAPLFALTSKIGKKVVTDPEFHWWDEPNALVRLQVAGALASDATVIDVVVDSTNPDEAAPGANWGDPRNLVPGDLLMVEPAADAAVFAPEVVEVIAPNSVALAAPATTFTVRRAASGTGLGVIADNAWLMKIGNAFMEGTRAPEVSQTNPIQYHNYCQIFKTTYELTGTAIQTMLRTGDPLKTDKKRKMFAHSREIETAILFGQRHIDTTGTKPKRYMDGLRAFFAAQNQTILNSAWTMKNLLDAVFPVFDWDTPAGNERIVFCGNGALNAFHSKIESQSNSIRVNYMGETKFYGMDLDKYRIPQGTLYLKSHPLLNIHPFYTNSWFIIDPTAIKWCPLRNRDTKFKDNAQLPDEDTRKGYWQTEAGLMVDYGGLTCGYVGGFNL